MLPNSPHVKEVVLGTNGVLEGEKQGTILIHMSSIYPIVIKDIAAQVQSKGIVMLDAPVSGGEPKAVDGTLSTIVGDPEKAIEEVEDILLVMGASAVLFREIGSGNVTKSLKPDNRST